MEGPDLRAVVPLVRSGLDVALAGYHPRVDELMWAQDPDRPVVEVLSGSLVVLYAFDCDDGFHLVEHADLARLDADQPGLAAAAAANLLDRLGDLQILERPDGCAMVRVDGNLEASVLLVPQLWHDIEQVLGDEVIVAVPATDIVLFCRAGNEATRQALRAARDRALSVGNHRVSEDLFRFSGGSWLVEPA